MDSRVPGIAVAESYPSGVVAMLFTDIQGSTRLWERNPTEMGAALDRHNELIRSRARLHRGVLPISQGEGDSAFIVFSQAEDAVACALDLQLALTTESWPESTPISVRMGIHSGPAESHAGDYFGTEVNRCARLREIAHGGQVLVSEAVANLVRDRLPADASLEDLGSHRLKDVSRAEKVFQLCHPDLPHDFPMLRSVERGRTNLPAPLTTFIGRHREKIEIGKLVEMARLTTLVGPGGIGKTRLALEVAADVQGRYPDGVWLVELAGLQDASLLLQVVAETLGLREEPGRDVLETLINHLRSKEALLLLDNCEHVLVQCARLADQLLTRCPTLRLVATSREPLKVAGENVFTVSPLSLPSEGNGSLMESDAIRLFVDRAMSVQPDFALTSSTGRAVEEICHRLDGLPLGIELAAARTRVISVHEIAERLDDRFTLLTTTSPTTSLRQQTLQRAIEWSHDLLSYEERLLFRRLSVFSGSFSIDAVEGVCSDDDLPRTAMLDLITSLIEKSLVFVESVEDVARYQMLESIRAYGRGLLEGSGEGEPIRASHAEWYATLAEAADRQVTGGQQSVWVQRLAKDHDNLRAALTWTTAHGDNEVALRLASGLTLFWFVRGYLVEGRTWIESALEGSENAPIHLRARALWGLGFLAGLLGDVQTAMPALQESLMLARQGTDPRDVARPLTLLGGFMSFQDPVGALPWLEESASLAEQAGDVWCLADALGFMGWAGLFRGDLETSRQRFGDCLRVARGGDEKQGMRTGLLGLSWLALWRGDYHDVGEMTTEALTVSRDLVDPYWVSFVYFLRGQVAHGRGNHDEAYELLSEALRMTEEIGQLIGIGTSMGVLASLELDRGNLKEARRFAEEALKMSTDMGQGIAIPWWQTTLAHVTLAEGDSETARSLAEDSLRRATEMGASREIGRASHVLAEVELADGSEARATQVELDALRAFAAVGDRPNMVRSIEALAALAADAGEYERAARLFGAVERAREQWGFARSPQEAERYAMSRALLRDRMTAEDLSSAWEAGGRLSLLQAKSETLAPS